MAIRFHSHALERMIQRGATEKEVIDFVLGGEQFVAKFGRTGFRRNFTFENQWANKYYKAKQIEVYAAKENNDWLVISVIVKYF